MKTLLIFTGKTTDKNIAAGIDDYVGRISHYMPFDIATIPELKNTKSLTQYQQKDKEGEMILKQVQPSDFVVLLDEHGKGCNKNSRQPKGWCLLSAGHMDFLMPFLKGLTRKCHCQR